MRCFQAGSCIFGETTSPVTLSNRYLPPWLTRFSALSVALLFSGVNVASSQVLPNPAPDTTPYSFCQRFNTLYIQIREQSIRPDSARATFSRIMLGLRQRYVTNNDFPTDTLSEAGRERVAMVFPLRGYGPIAIGGTHGEGYRGVGFDLFDYNVRGSHPAQDIFIRDSNQDSIDDRTGQYVDVLSMTEGLVLAVETGWNPGQVYRGGNWVWVYDPVRNGLFYYAHNSSVSVAMGDWVRAGQKLAAVGRTGFNAYKPRSPTHLHLMYLQIQPNGLPLPRNPYDWLLKSERVKE
jgi:peptidoglycan LD-endopeptidase LytH